MGVVVVRKVEIRGRPVTVLVAMLLVAVVGGWWSWLAAADEDQKARVAVPRGSVTAESEEPVYYYSSFVAIDPCRLFDTRSNPAWNIGPRSTPLGPGETYDQRVWWDNGYCWIPDDAAAIALNVTIVSPTASSYLTLFPADVTRPAHGSNLNWRTGQGPTPNKVDVRISEDGWVSIYNNAGTVDVLADVVGYYSWWPLEDLNYRLSQLEELM